MRVIIAAGGTGGHLYPGVAIAREFERQLESAKITFVGTSRGIETKVMPREGYELVTMKARGIMGKGPIGGIVGLAVTPLGLAQCLALCRARRPDLVIGIGGYTSPPLVTAATLLGIKRVILEPNAYPGMANRLLSPLAHLVFVSFAEALPFFDARKTRVVGTPIRRAFLDLMSSGNATPGADSPAHVRGPLLLVLGGSQGARSINRAMTGAFPILAQSHPGMRIIHQTGERDFEEVATTYRAAVQQGFPVAEPEVAAFLFDVPRALTQADLIIGRSGATTVAEITACGKPAIFIPFPHAIHGHQERNARVLEQAGAAQVILDHNLSGTVLAQAVSALINDPQRLAEMGRHSRSLGRPDAAEQVVHACRELVGRA
ncbi:MAG TPA: undecaprenyldiphospho-muramoylpentapeptide beta-N-acetylglucosaminyltransferase [Nitrospirales bacterium]|jgi:UDP-N-acetylglucosamine--N-acetylmuramyl-(pentapeptide) pyrophosphoryl-undecaprenol N-acetylglucosamine transferase